MNPGGSDRRLICIGKIVGVWGRDGRVKVHAYTRNRLNIFEYKHWFVGTAGRARRYDLEAGYEQGRGLVAKLVSLDDRDAAAGEVGALVHVTPEQLPALAEGEYFWHQLKGLAVETADGTWLGTVDHLMETGANDVLVVKGDKERLIPYVDQVVRDVDLEAGTIRVDWDPDF